MVRNIKPPKPVKPTRDERKAVAALVARYLEPHQPKGFRLEVNPKGMEKRDDCWYVVVEPTNRRARSYDYFGRMAEAEQDLSEHENIDVLLVPVIPPEDD